MTGLRRHLRAWAMAWCLVQAAALASLLPVGCCAAHEPAAEAPACHEAARATQCPMRGAGGAPCPMHAGPADSGHPVTHAAHDAHDAPDSTPRRACAIGSACDGPTVFTLFSQAGLVPAVIVANAPPPADARHITAPVDPAPTRTRTPEPHPPRACPISLRA